MKKNLIYLSILVVLAVVAYFAFNKKKRLYPIEDANFKVENVEEVDKIFLSDAAVGNIRLTKDENGTWYVNDSMRARQDWVAYLLDAFEKQDASQLIPKSMHNNIIKQLSSSSVKVEVFKGDKKTNQFYVSKQPGKENLTVMLNIREDGTNAPRPFLVKHGVSNTFLGVRYNTALEDWLDKQILYFDAHKLKDISVSYPRKPESNYTMTVNPSIGISPKPDSVADEFNKPRAQKYVAFYDKLFCMGFENDYVLKDTFVKAFTPLAEVVVRSTEGEEKNLKVYYKPRGKDTHRILTFEGREYDGDAFFGWLNNRDFVLLSSLTVQKMLREPIEFFMKDEIPTSPSE